MPVALRVSVPPPNVTDSLSQTARAKQTDHHHQSYRTDDRHSNSVHDGIAQTYRYVNYAQQPIANESAYQPHHDITDDAIARASEKESSEPTGHAADHDNHQDGFTTHVRHPWITDRWVSAQPPSRMAQAAKLPSYLDKQTRKDPKCSAQNCIGKSGKSPGVSPLDDISIARQATTAALSLSLSLTRDIGRTRDAALMATDHE